VSARTKILIFLALIALGAIAAFAPALNNGFTNWDDNRLVTQNPVIRHFSGTNLAAMFSYAYSGTYIPLTLLSWTVDYQLWGLNPRGFHLGNLLLHSLNALLVFGLIYALTRNPLAAFAAGLLFAVHPLRAESVAWIAERKDVLFTFLYLLALLAYIRYVRKPSGQYYGLCLGLFILSGLAKGAALTLPLILFLIDFFLARKYKPRLIGEKIPFLAAAAALAVLALFAQGTLQSTRLPLIRRFLMANWVADFYLLKTLIPVKLSALYPYPENFAASLPLAFVIAPFINALILSLVVYSLKFTRKIFFGAMFFAAALLPVSQVVTVAGPEIAANRYSYLPLVGIFYLAGEGGTWLWTRKRISKVARFALPAAGAVVTLFLILISQGRCRTWRDSVSLWTDVLSKNPRIPEAYNNRGIAYANVSDYDRAVADYRRALALDPNFARAFINRGLVYQQAGDFIRALLDLDQAVALAPRDADAYYNRGNVFMKLEDYQKAVSDYSAAVRNNPGYFQAYTNRGNAFCRTGAYDRGIADYDTALAVNPEFGEAYYNRAVAFLLKKDYERAWRDVEKLLRMRYPINPDFLSDLRRASGRDR
jgi:tetratricopeptide (TPR) repeat protein